MAANCSHIYGISLKIYNRVNNNNLTAQLNLTVKFRKTTDQNVSYSNQKIDLEKTETYTVCGSESSTEKIAVNEISSDTAVTKATRINTVLH